MIELLILLFPLIILVAALHFMGSDVLWFTRPKVNLIDYWLVVRPSRVHNIRGQKIAYVYPLFKIGQVILLENGKIHPESEATYIDSWKDA